MPLRFAYTRPDGGVSIVMAAPPEHLVRVIGKPVYPKDAKTGETIKGASPLRYELSEADYRAHVIERSIPADATNVTELPEDWAPPDDRTFRDAWKLNGKGVEVDMPKARELHMGRIRAKRNAALAKLDVETMKALGNGDVTVRDKIEAKKQTMRDIPQTLDLSKAETPAELKALWPAELLRAVSP